MTAVYHMALFMFTKHCKLYNANDDTEFEKTTLCKEFKRSLIGSLITKDDTTRNIDILLK